MRRILLTSVAAAALLAGPTLAMAQSSPEPKQSPGASSQQSTQSPKANADREKGQKSSQSQPQHRDTTGSSTSGQMPKSKDDNKAADQQENRGAKSKQSQKSEQGKSPENQSNAAQKSGKSDAAQKSGKSGTSDAAQKSNASDNERSKGAQTEPSGQKGQSKQSQSPKNERSTTGQSSSDQPTKGDRMNRDNAKQQAPNANQQGQGRAQEGQSRTGTSSGTAGQSGSTTTSQTQQSQSSTSVKPEVQSKFSETIEKRNIKTSTNVNVDVSVGRTIPRSVTVYDVPTDIVRINPEFRGKKFTVVRDEIVIIEPKTHKVVSVMPRSGGRSTTGTSTSVQQSSSRVNLSADQRRTVRETVLKEQSAPRCQDVQVSVGSQVSTSVQFTPFPQTVVTEVPELRSYQFCIHNNDVVLVNPSDRRVVELLD